MAVVYVPAAACRGGGECAAGRGAVDDTCTVVARARPARAALNWRPILTMYTKC